MFTESVADAKSRAFSPLIERLRLRRRDFPGTGFASDQDLSGFREADEEEEEEEKKQSS